MAKKQTLRIDLKAKNLTKTAFTGVLRGLNGIKRAAVGATTSITKNLRGFQNQAAALLGVLGGFQAFVKAPAEFGNEMAKVGTLGQEARDRLAEFTDEVRNLSVESGIGPNKLADGLFNVISAGTEASRAMEVLRASTKLAVAGSADLTSVVSGLSVVANAFNVTTTEGFEELSKNLFAAQVIGKTNIENLSANVGKLGATFADSSIDVTQMFTALADITTVSSNTEEAATSLRSAITAILKPSERLQRVMKDVGIPMGAAAFEGRNLGEVFSAISKRSKELNIPLAQVIGNANAVTAAVTLGAENGERYNRALQKQQEFLGELDKSYRLMQGTLNSVLNRFGQLLTVLSQEFSSGLLVGLDEGLMVAIENIERLRAEAVVMGLEVRLAFEKSIPAIRNTIDLVLMLGEGFMFAIDAGKKLLDILIGQTNVQKSMAQAGKLADAINETRDLKKEYNSLGDSIRRSMEFRKSLVDSNDIGAAVEEERQFRERRSEISVQIRMAEAAQREARQALRDLSQAPVDPSIERMADRSESIRERFDKVFLGGNAANEDALGRLEDSLKRAKKALQNIGKEGEKAGQGVADGLGQGGEAVTDTTQKVRTFMEVLAGFKEVAKDSWEGFKTGVMKAVDGMKTLKERMEDLGARFVQIASNSLARFFDSIAQGTADSSEAFKQFARAVLSEINRVMADKIVQEFVSLIAGAFAGAATAGAAPAPQGGTGPVTIPPIPTGTFSKGGVVTGPTAALIGEGGMNEAVVPLPNGRSIPVQFSKGAPAGDNITININAVDGPSVERMLSSASGRRAIEGAVRNAKATRRDLR